MTTLVERLRDEAGLCRNETAEDVAALLDEAAAEIERLTQSSTEGWRYADELEQERKRLEALVIELLAEKEVGYMAKKGGKGKGGKKC